MGSLLLPLPPAVVAADLLLLERMGAPAALMVATLEERQRTQPTRVLAVELLQGRGMEPSTVEVVAGPRKAVVLAG